MPPLEIQMKLPLSPGLDGRIAQPRQFHAIGEAAGLPGVSVKLDIDVDARGRGHCRRLELTAGEYPLTGKAMRLLRLGELVKEATAAAGSQVVNLGETEPGVTTLGPASPEEAEAIYRELHPVRRTRRNEPLSDRDLKAIAELYRAAVKHGNPTQTVADRVSPPVSRSTASRWIGEARDAGYLGPALKGRAGELT